MTLKSRQETSAGRCSKQSSSLVESCVSCSVKEPPQKIGIANCRTRPWVSSGRWFLVIQFMSLITGLSQFNLSAVILYLKTLPWCRQLSALPPTYPPPLISFCLCGKQGPGSKTNPQISSQENLLAAELSYTPASSTLAVARRRCIVISHPPASASCLTCVMDLLMA